MKATVYDCLTKQTYELDMTPEEIAQLEAMQNEQVDIEQEPTLEERVADIEQVTEKVITALNEKGIVS